MIKLSDYVMQFLVAQGVRHVFVLPGGGAMHLVDSLGRRKDLPYVCFLHEQALAIAAEAYGQFTNFPGVGLVTSGPGSTNAITGVAAAYLDSTPCFFISGQAKRPDLKGSSGVRQMGSQEVDIVSMVSCITKYARTVLEPDEIRLHLEKAWHAATTGRKGPVWLDIPLDVQAAQIDETRLTGFTPPPAPPPAELPEWIEATVRLLNEAQRPLLLCGNGVKLAGAQAALRRFAETHRIPVLLTWKALDFLPHDHPLNFGSPGILGARAANFILQNADVLVVLGSRLDTSVTAFNAPGLGRNARKIMVDVDAAEVRKIPGLAVGAAADAGDFLRALEAQQARLTPRTRETWLAYCRDLRSRYPTVLEEHRRGTDGISPYLFSEELYRHLTERDIITPASSGVAGEALYQAPGNKAGQLIKNAAGLGAMGFGLPDAIGGCLACDRRRTILVDGDGAFQLNLQELQTVVRLNLPIKIFIFENNGYASIVAMQRNACNGFLVASDPSSGLTLPDLCAVAGAYGIRHVRAATPAELAPAIAATLAGDDPALCCIRISPAHVASPKVQAMKLPDGSMVSKPLEDMWPYLPAEEVAANMIAEKKGA